MHVPTAVTKPRNSGAVRNGRTGRSSPIPLSQLCSPCRLSWAGAEADCSSCGLPGRCAGRGSSLQSLIAQITANAPKGEAATSSAGRTGTA